MWIAVSASVCLFLVWLLLDHYLNPILARRRLKRLLKAKGRVDPRALENPRHGTILPKVDCLTVKSEKNSWKLPWNEVEEVHAFKRDLFATDLICLAFKRIEKEEYYELHEEMAGYHDLIEGLPAHLPGFTLQWFSEVAFPAFETNHRIIWKRPPDPSA